VILETGRYGFRPLEEDDSVDLELRHLALCFMVDVLGKCRSINVAEDFIRNYASGMKSHCMVGFALCLQSSL
jgi:hypothetical protein